MSQRLKIFLPLAVLGGGALLALLIVNARPPVERDSSESPPPLIRVVEAERVDLEMTVASQGTVRPRTESVLVAQAAGRIIHVSESFAAGGFFEHGQVLVRIDPRDYELALSQAEVRLAQAQVRLDLERAETEIARRDWEDLGEDAEPSALTLREPQMAEAQANLEGAEAAVELAKLNLERTVVKAPFPGRVRAKNVDVGQFVGMGTPLATVFSIAEAEVQLPVSKDDLGFLAVGLGIDLDNGEASSGGPEVTLHAVLGGERRTWPARIVRTGSELDPKTRMLSLYARVDDPFGRRRGGDRMPLPMGLFVEAEIRGRTARGVVLLPRTALRDERTLLVADADDRLRFREVEVLRAAGDTVIVSSGLENGDRVCVSPIDAVVDGMRVRVASEEIS